VGLAYFFTESSVSGSSSEAFASSTNYQDANLAASAAAGIYIPISKNRHPVSMDVSLRYHWNGRMSYLKEGSIQDGSNGTIFISPITSRADFLVWHVGVSVGI
jgi:hypothetical protein